MGSKPTGEGVSVSYVRRAEESYWAWYFWNWPWSLDNEEVIAQKGVVPQKKYIYSY